VWYNSSVNMIEPLHRPVETDSASPLWVKTLFAFLFLVYILGGLYFGYLFFGTLRALAGRQPGPLEPAPPEQALQQSESQLVVPAPTPDPTLQPEVVSGPPPTWERGRVNILLLGVDQRECDDTGGAWRTDTMILVSLDPATKSAVMLSFPRDLWVNIPTIGPNRLNAAHFFGDAYKYPGGGPALVKQTIQDNFAVPVHYYVRINFDGFRQVVDAIGGIDIDVEEPIWDDKYPTDDCGYQTVHFEAGHYHMDGDQALKYARSRHYSSDFDRGRRQRQVMFAIYEKATSIRIIPRLPELWGTKDKAIQTDLSLLDSLKLARLGMQIERDQIRGAAIDESMTENMITDRGWQVLNWDRQKVGALIRDLFSSPDSTVNLPDASAPE
jgi:LCP family protein required for cell wall assembly